MKYFITAVVILLIPVVVILSYNNNIVSDNNLAKTMIESSNNEINPSEVIILENQNDNTGIEDISVNNNQHQLRKEILNIVHNHMLSKYNIIVTDNEVLEYLKKTFDNKISDHDFLEIQENVEAQINAAQDVLYNKVTPKDAANKHLNKWGGASVWEKELSSMSLDRLNEMKSMLPKSISDMYEKSIKGNRYVVETIKIAKELLPNEELNDDINKWKLKFENKLLIYAKDNLLGQHSKLSNISANDIDQLIEMSQ